MGSGSIHVARGRGRRSPGKGPDDLEAKVIRGLHDFALAHASAPLDEGGLVDRSRQLVPDSPLGSGTFLVVSAAGGPARQVLRPAELEDAALHQFLLGEALTSANSVLRPTVGTNTLIIGDTITLQQDGSGSVSLDETGSVVVVQPALEGDAWQAGIASLIEETVAERISQALRLVASVLDHVDQPRRLSHVAVTAALLGVGYLPWRTREEQAQSPNAATMGVGNQDRILAQVSPAVRRRAALSHDTHRLAEDLTLRLRREVKQ